MNPFPMGDEISIWFATSRTSRKVTEIKRNPKVSVYFADHVQATGDPGTNKAATIVF